MCILGAESKNFISCPHIWTLNYEKNQTAYSAGDLFLVTEHANMSAQAPGIGPNIDEFGPRFYDISQMYVNGLTEAIKESLGEELKYCVGDVFWVNNKTVPN